MDRPGKVRRRGAARRGLSGRRGVVRSVGNGVTWLGESAGGGGVRVGLSRLDGPGKVRRGWGGEDG